MTSRRASRLRRRLPTLLRLRRTGRRPGGGNVFAGQNVSTSWIVEDCQKTGNLKSFFIPVAIRRSRNSRPRVGEKSSSKRSANLLSSEWRYARGRKSAGRHWATATGRGVSRGRARRAAGRLGLGAAGARTGKTRVPRTSGIAPLSVAVELVRPSRGSTGTPHSGVETGDAMWQTVCHE